MRRRPRSRRCTRRAGRSRCEPVNRRPSWSRRASTGTAAAMSPQRRLAEQFVAGAPPRRRVARAAAARCGSGSAAPAACTGVAARLGDPQPEHDRRHGGVGSARASSTSNSRSLIGALARARSGEEVVERRVASCRRRSRASSSRRSPDQLVAGVDRHEVALGRVGPARGADEERLDVGLQRRQLRVGGDELVPRVERRAATRWRRPGPGRTRRRDRASS